MKPFFSGFTWPFSFLESRSASAGLFLSIFLIATAATAAGITVYGYAYDSLTGANTAGGSSDTSASQDYASCNTIGIEIRDCIMTYRPDNAEALLGSVDSPCRAITSSEEVIWKLDAAANNPQIKAVILDIDSTGGSGVAAEEIAASMKNLGKPSIAWVRESADSAAYWIASAADTIIASEGSDVGSIGVTMSYVDNAKQNAKDGLTYNQLTTGKYKDTGTHDRALTADERALLQRDLDIALQNFIKAVARNRHLPVEKVTELADGSTMMGAMALQNGLIDQIGSKQEVWTKLGNLIQEEPDVCWD